MYARFAVRGQDQLRATIVARIDRLADFSPLLPLAGAIARDAAIVRIRDEGQDVDPAWKPSKKTLGASVTVRHRQTILGVTVYPGEVITASGYGKTGTDTRTMANSIDYRVTASNHVTIGTGVPYARTFQFGSGIFGVGPNSGHTAWTILPRTKRALSWTFGGVRFIAREVHADGQPPRPFLFFSPADVSAILKAWASALSAPA